MSNFKVFDLSNTSDISLTKDGFRNKGDSAKCFLQDHRCYHCFRGWQLEVRNRQEETVQHFLHHTAQWTIGESACFSWCDWKDNLPYRTNDNEETLFKVKMIPDMRIMDKDKKPIRINIKDVPCITLRDFKEAMVDIAINWGKQGIRNWRWWCYFFRNSYGYSDESYR